MGRRYQLRRATTLTNEPIQSKSKLQSHTPKSDDGLKRGQSEEGTSQTDFANMRSIGIATKEASEEEMLSNNEILCLLEQRSGKSSPEGFEHIESLLREELDPAAEKEGDSRHSGGMLRGNGSQLETSSLFSSMPVSVQNFVNLPEMNSPGAVCNGLGGVQKSGTVSENKKADHSTGGEGNEYGSDAIEESLFTETDEIFSIGNNIALDGLNTFQASLYPTMYPFDLSTSSGRRGPSALSYQSNSSGEYPGQSPRSLFSDIKASRSQDLEAPDSTRYDGADYAHSLVGGLITKEAADGEGPNVLSTFLPLFHLNRSISNGEENHMIVPAVGNPNFTLNLPAGAAMPAFPYGLGAFPTDRTADAYVSSLPTSTTSCSDGETQVGRHTPQFTVTMDAIDQHELHAPHTVTSPPGTPKVRQCKMLNCNRHARTRGLCMKHGGGKRCRVPHCTRGSQGGGLCIAHGGGKKCLVKGCTKSKQAGGMCVVHRKQTPSHRTRRRGMSSPEGETEPHPFGQQSGNVNGDHPGFSGSAELQQTFAPETMHSFTSHKINGTPTGLKFSIEPHAPLPQLCRMKRCTNACLPTSQYCSIHRIKRQCAAGDCHRASRAGGFCEKHARSRRCGVDGCSKIGNESGGLCSYHAAEKLFGSSK